MDPVIFWEQLGIRKPNSQQTTIALAIFAVENVNEDSRKIESYAGFKEDLEEDN